jgi:hypothetical protein
MCEWGTLLRLKNVVYKSISSRISTVLALATLKGRRLTILLIYKIAAQGTKIDKLGSMLSGDLDI